MQEKKLFQGFHLLTFRILYGDLSLLLALKWENKSFCPPTFLAKYIVVYSCVILYPLHV